VSDLARPRFYVIATTGYSLSGGGAGVATAYAVLDRLWAYREVFSDYPSASPGLPDFVRRARAEAHAERANVRHEQRMRELAA
jgi:hypothetical protein